MRKVITDAIIDEAVRLRREDMPWMTIAKKLGVNMGTLFNAVERSPAKPLGRKLEHLEMRPCLKCRTERMSTREQRLCKKCQAENVAMTSHKSTPLGRISK